MQPSDPTPATPLPAPDPMEAFERAFARQCERVRNRVEGEYGPYTNADWTDVNTMYREALAAYQSVRESGPMFQLLTGERVMLHGCRIIADKDVPQDEAHIYDHRGNLTGRITGLTARRTGGTE
jgi:hypothetical protein